MIRDAEALAERARDLVDCNGLRLVRVVLVPAGTPTQAQLSVEFHNQHGLADILAAATPATAPFLFPISGGLRLRAGPLAGQVRVISIQPDPAGDPRVLLLTVEPIGDYTTYTLGVDPPAGVCIDPVFGELRFRFRPGCFELCPPDWEAPRPARPAPAIDYLAKDYESFRHQAIAWMMDRVPDWQPTSEADLDMTLLELFAAASDELSDYQDRVMTEAYLGTARKRVSLARHARLVDYHIQQGNQGSTWLSLETIAAGAVPLATPFVARTHQDAGDPAAVFFAAFAAPPDRPPHTLHPALNEIALHTWSDGIPALAEGSTSADLAMPSAAVAAEVETLIRDGVVTHLLIEELRNPLTGLVGGRDPSKRQLLELLPGDAGAASLRDPVEGDAPFVRVRWRDEDRLEARYCFVIDCSGTRVDGVSCFHGNLVPARQGRLETAVFHEPGEALPAFPIPGEIHLSYTQGLSGEALCPLPSPFVAYRATPPGGEVPPRSTVEVEIAGDPWDEVSSLVFSTDDAETGDHFVVETDEDGWSVLRFGDGTNGRRVPAGETVRCTYQVGRGLDGNVGADSLVYFDNAAFAAVGSCRNPLDVTDGRAPEEPASIVRNAPEAFRKRQLRAVTLPDYVRRAEEVPGVARAAAAYQWTGSWRAVRVTIDPAASFELTDPLAGEVFQHLDAVRLIGDDLEVRGPEFVPLKVTVTVCIHPDYWPRDVRFLLEAEFSTGYAPDGSMAFFHPDRWTFGQPLRASEIVARAQKVEGVHHVVAAELRRLYDALPAGDVVTVGPSQIVLVENDPDHYERGVIRFELEGGRA